MKLALVPLLLTLLVPSLAESADENQGPDWEVEQFVIEGEATPLIFEQAKRRAALRDLFRRNAEPVFSSLADDSWIEVDFETQGCFHTFRRILKIYGGANPRIEVSTPGFFPEDDLKGEIPLSEDDLKELDVLLNYYRSPREGSCTTTENVVFRWKSGQIFPRTASEEVFSNESCGPHDSEKLLTFWELLYRLERSDAV